MNRNSLRPLIAFSIVIQLIAIYLFYVILPTELGFIPTILAFIFACVVSVFALISYKKSAINEGYHVNIILVMACLYGTEFIAILIRLIMLITNN